MADALDVRVGGYTAAVAVVAPGDRLLRLNDAGLDNHLEEAYYSFREADHSSVVASAVRSWAPCAAVRRDRAARREWVVAGNNLLVAVGEWEVLVASCRRCEQTLFERDLGVSLPAGRTLSERGQPVLGWLRRCWQMQRPSPGLNAGHNSAGVHTLAPAVHRNRPWRRRSQGIKRELRCIRRPIRRAAGSESKGSAQDR